MADDQDRVSVATGKLHRFVLGPRVECSELSGPHFEFDRTFIKPAGMDALQPIAETVRGKTGKKAAIFGHTDTVGDEVYNKKLSEERAHLVFASFTHDPDAWEDRYQKEHWGTHAVQVMLNAVQPPEDKSPRLSEDGVLGPKTSGAIKAFQGRSDLDPDGDAGPATRKELFLAYMRHSIPEPLGGDRFLDVGGSKFMGCGEYNPFTEGVADEASRRVVVVLFSPSTEPSGLPCALGDTGPCKGNLRGEDEPPPPDDTRPHFRCKVYRGISERCPCGPGAELMPIHVQIHDEIYKPCGHLPYRLILPSRSVVCGKTDENGWIVNAVPKGKQKVQIDYASPTTDQPINLRVFVTDADPGSDEAMLCHLRNFGFTHDDDSDVGAILRFQAAKNLERTGEIDDPTREAISEIIKGGDDSLGDVLRADAG
ncbi:MAG: peptidoglycan-binding protein [Byssovorax sp.]